MSDSFPTSEEAQLTLLLKTILIKWKFKQNKQTKAEVVKWIEEKATQSTWANTDGDKLELNLSFGNQGYRTSRTDQPLRKCNA